MVHFVGAGSGAADLITVRGARLLAEADVIIYAGSLVNPELLSYAKPGCEIHNSATMTLEEVIAVMRDAEAAGKTTVRLHTGDSSIYGAVREQFDELEKLQISYDARYLADRLFHPRRACRAAHASHIVLLHAFHLFDLSCLPVACPAFAYFISFCSVTTSSSITSSCPSRISFATHERR